MVTAALIGFVTEGQVCIFKAEPQAPRDEAVIYIAAPGAWSWTTGSAGTSQPGPVCPTEWGQSFLSTPLN